MRTIGIGLAACCVLLAACAPDLSASPASAPPPVTMPAEPAPASVVPVSEATTAAPTPEPPQALPPAAPTSPAPASEVPKDNPTPNAPSSVEAATNAVPAATVQAWLQKQPADAEKVIFLTFDDGPNHEMTPRVLDTLKREGVHATFFVLGKSVEAAPEVLKRLVAEGNAVGLHSYSHNYKFLYPQRTGRQANIVKEYEQSVAAIRGVLGESFTPTAWRYPGGHMSWKGLAPADAALAEQGVHWVDWNALNGDAEPKKRRPTTSDAMVQTATQPIKAGIRKVVLLAHDSRGKELTLSTLPQVIAAYKAAGYQFRVIG